VIFLGFLFGYLVAMIFYKWIMFEPADSQCAPALLIRTLPFLPELYKDAHTLESYFVLSNLHLQITFAVICPVWPFFI
jgi:hypothetical protein